jgi:DNA mismatch repair protein MutS
MEVLDQDGELIFLRKLKEGPAAESYGLHVARLAGLAEPVLNRAARILERVRLRRAAVNDLPAPEPAAEKPGAGEPAVPRPVDSRLEQLLAEIAALDPDRMTPLEALNIIIRWKRVFSTFPVSGKSSSPKKSKIIEKNTPSLFDD